MELENCPKFVCTHLYRPLKQLVPSILVLYLTYTLLSEMIGWCFFCFCQAVIFIYFIGMTQEKSSRIIILAKYWLIRSSTIHYFFSWDKCCITFSFLPVKVDLRLPFLYLISIQLSMFLIVLSDINFCFCRFIFMCLIVYLLFVKHIV